MNYVSNLARSEGDPKILSSGPSSLPAADRLGRALGWFSIALGVTELIAPRRLTRALGMEGRERLVRAYGAREIGAGVLSLSTERSLGLWGRVAGDALDIATVMPALRWRNPKRRTAKVALAMLVGVALVDWIAAQAVSSRHARKANGYRPYSDRSGFPKGVEAARGAATGFETPPDMRAELDRAGASESGASTGSIH